MKISKVSIDHRIPLLILQPDTPKGCGVLWIHGGGYFLGMKEMVFKSRAMDLVNKYGATVFVPGYRLAFQSPYPAALEDCYKALLYMKDHAEQYNINSKQIMVGGESAGGGLCASLCILARDRKEVKIAYQMPLYPMVDNFDTPSSKDNHGKVWNTRRNHLGWKLYLRDHAKEKVSPYASAARETNYSNLPPAYTFVGNKEPFYCETITYIQHLKENGIEAKVDVFPSDTHAFDMLHPNWAISKLARNQFNHQFEYAMKHYFSE